jgi:hypothetical protein
MRQPLFIIRKILRIRRNYFGPVSSTNEQCLAAYCNAVQECDATMLKQRMVVGNKKLLFYH